MSDLGIPQCLNCKSELGVWGECQNNKCSDQPDIQKKTLISKIKNYSKDEKINRAKFVLNSLKQRKWESDKAYEQWSSQIIPWREELVLLGKMMKQ